MAEKTTLGELKIEIKYVVKIFEEKFDNLEKTFTEQAKRDDEYKKAMVGRVNSIEDKQNWLYTKVAGIITGISIFSGILLRKLFG